MLNNNLFSDVKFVVRGESETKQVIPAHKFVLSISSPVFEAMSYGELAETTDSDWQGGRDQTLTNLAWPVTPTPAK